jgi:hypothetical protein
MDSSILLAITIIIIFIIIAIIYIVWIKLSDCLENRKKNVLIIHDTDI